MTILVVEDDPVSMRLLEMALRRGGYEVAAVTSAATAFEWLKQGSAVELIITDLNLGGMSGLQLFTALHADPRWRDLPAILCTSSADKATVTEAIHRGFTHFVAKPIRPDYLIEKIKAILVARVPVIESKFETLQRLQLSEAEYRMLVKTTHDHLKEVADRLTAAQAAKEYPEAIIITRSFRETIELLRAGRCATALSALDEATNDWQRDRALDLVGQEVATLIEVLLRILRYVPKLDASRSLATGP